MKLLVKIGCLLLVAVMGSAALVAAKGPQNVAMGLHNLSQTGQDPIFGASFYRTDEDQICVFCHTPHGGLLSGPLWNKNLPAANSFTHYNSASLSSAITDLGAARDVNDESLLCMACHDGSLSVNHVVNLPNDRNGALIETQGGDDLTFLGPYFTVVGARIGASPDDLSGTGDLTDDHPISFSYDDVLTSPNYALPTSPKFGELRTIAEATTWAGEGVRFFGDNNRVECSSCHDPHVNYNTHTDVPVPGDSNYTPFLIMPNTGSNLCFACHNK